MGSVEAAASLFGSSDSGSDLDFLTAPEAGNSASESPAGASNELFESQDSSGLFDANDGSAAVSSLFDIQEEANTHTYGQNETRSEQTEAYQPDTEYDYGQSSHSLFDRSGGSDASYAEGWYDGAGQWHSYEHQQVVSATTAHTGTKAPVSPRESSKSNTATGVSNTTSQYGVQDGNTASPYGYHAAYVPTSSSFQSPYDPYKPPAHMSAAQPAPAGQSQLNVYGYIATTSPYDPYKPSGVTSQQAPPSPYAASAPSPYDPYRRVASQSRSPPAAPPPSLPQSGTFTSGAGLIPPPDTIGTSKPPASPYRPPTANAYDPPLPAIKSKKSFTATAFQHHSGPYSPQSATSPPPPPPPARKMSSPPRVTSSLPSSPPHTLRSSMYSPPKVPSVAYAQASFAMVERSGSPYDPPPSRQYKPSGSNSYENQNHSHPQVNGRYASPSSPLASYGSPVSEKHATFTSDLASTQQDTGDEQHSTKPHHDESTHFVSLDGVAAVTSQGNVNHGSTERAGEFAYSAGPSINDAEMAELGTSSRPVSSYSSGSRRGASQSPISGRRARMSPDVVSHLRGSQRATLPVSESTATQPISYPHAPPSQYGLQHNGVGSHEIRERSMSNISSFSTSSSAYDPYAPSVQTVKQQELSPYAGNSYAAPPTVPSSGSLAGAGRASLESSYSPPPITGPYAPSPSLLGTNDPLGRANAKVPVISFGFGGKFVTCFHSAPTLDTGFDVALSSRKCTDVHIRQLYKTIPESALSASSAAYPGPLFGDPGSPVATLVRSTGSANAKSKTKKAKVLSYLTDRAEELERGLGYLAAGSVDKRRADGKLALVRLLHVLVEHDGQIYGSSSAESAARAALLPRLGNSQDAIGANAFLNAPTGASLAAGTFRSSGSNEKPLAEYVVRRSALETLQDFLLRGEKRKAYHYALDEKLWAHAMVISSGLDKEAFKEVISEFVRTELGVKAGSRPDVPVTNGLESLRLAYSLYSGQSSTAVQHLLPTKSLQAGPSLTLQPPTPVNHMTPLSPNFPPPSLATNISPEILSQWPEYAVMLFSGQMGAESSSALTTLGDYLLSNDWVEAAHCCYILSPQSSPIGGVGAPSVRVVLVGSHSLHRNVLFSTDPDAFIFSEILEFALSLHAPAKGQETFSGLPHLQAYRLIRAFQLAEIGHTTLAKRYCEAITGHASRSSPYVSQLFSDQLRELYNRLNGDPELDKPNSWISGKIAKPSLDSLGGWLEGTLTKFVAGEEGSSPGRGDLPSTDNSTYVNAFSRYSNISSTNNSRGASPAPSFVNNSGIPYNVLPGRSGSAADTRSAPSYSPNVRASPGIDYESPGSARNTPPPRVLSADSSAPSFGQPHSLSQAMGGYNSGVNSNGHHIGNGTAAHGKDIEKPQGGGGWWSAVYGDSENATPTANSFSNTDSHVSEAESGGSGSGFISLMDNYNPFTPSPSASTFTNKKVEEPDEFDDDLGLGNSTMKRKTEKMEEHDDDSKTQKEEPVKEETKKPDTKPEVTASSSSWGFSLGRLFSRPTSTKPAPVKANLGEETSFYYDKELKRWVNKKSGAEPAKPAAPPPPPSRAQTVSPSRHTQSANSGPPPPSPMPPPGRPLSAMDAGSSGPPKRTLTPLRSSLIPEEGPSAPASAPPTPAVMSSLSAAPPTGRPKSAAKRSARSRYVDVFQQP